MLFSRRDTQLEPNFAQRFSNIIGQYLTPPIQTTNQVKYDNKINTYACYALLGEKQDDYEYKLPALQQQLKSIAKKHYQKTNKSLKQEQIALAALKIESEKQASILRHRFFSPDFSNSTLFSNIATSPLHLALLSNALNLSSFCDTTALPAPPKFKAKRHMVNSLLSDITMKEIEAHCRDLSECCSEAMIGRGADTDSLQSNWQLRMRYNNSSNSLLLKCMPIEMLRDTFNRQYKEQFGQTNPKQKILIESLEVTVSCENECTTEMQTGRSLVERFMKVWQQNNTGSSVTWSRSSGLDELDSDFDYLNCTVLKKILASKITETSESKLSNFFIQKS